MGEGSVGKGLGGKLDVGWIWGIKYSRQRLFSYRIRTNLTEVTNKTIELNDYRKMFGKKGLQFKVPHQDVHRTTLTFNEHGKRGKSSAGFCFAVNLGRVGDTIKN